jgi:hypothetical protein
MAIEYTDRYEATGIRPDPETMCPGPCEGLGVVPVHLEPRGEVQSEPETDPALVKAFLDAVEAGQKPDELGYIFVTCPTCKGTRLKSGSAG